MNTVIRDVCLTKATYKDMSIDNCEPAIAKVNIERNWTCPHCGESHYMVNHSDSTCMYFPPIYKDGVNINPDRNIITTHCTCMECGKNFEIKNR